MMPREKWTDERLDDLNKSVDEGFAETRAEMREGFVRVEGEIKRIDGNIERLDGDIKRIDRSVSELGREINIRFDAVNRNMFAGVVAIVAAILGGNAF